MFLNEFRTISKTVLAKSGGGGRPPLPPLAGVTVGVQEMAGDLRGIGGIACYSSLQLCNRTTHIRMFRRKSACTHHPTLNSINGPSGKSLSTNWHWCDKCKLSRGGGQLEM